MRSNTDFGGKIMNKWEQINNKRSHSHLSYSHSRPIPISLSNLVPHSHWNPTGGMGIPHFPFPCISLLHSAHSYPFCNFVTLLANILNKKN